VSLGVVPLRPQESDVVIVGRLANTKVGLQRFWGRECIDFHLSQILGWGGILDLWAGIPVAHFRKIFIWMLHIMGVTEFSLAQGDYQIGAEFRLSLCE
jgi:hypothetical protein